MKLLVRITILFTAIYFMLAAALSYLFDIEFVCDLYIPLCELDVCVIASSQGKYHCRYIKWLAWAVFLTDSTLRADMAFDFIPASILWMTVFGIFSMALLAILIMAIRHFVKVKRTLR